MKTNRLKRFLFSLLPLALIGLAVHAGLSDDGGKTAGVGLAAMACVGIPQRKMDANPDDPGAGFQAKVLSGIGEVKKQFGEIEIKVTELDKETKKLTDDFATKVKSFEGLPNQVADIMRGMQSIQMKVAQHHRSSYGGGAIARISGDEQMRSAINGIIRMAATRGNAEGLPADQLKGFQDFQAVHKALTTGSTPGSSYVHEQLIPEIYALIAEYGIWRDFDVIPVSAKSAKLIVDTTDPDMLWIDEGTEPTEAAYAGSSITATIKKMLGWIGISNELIQDSNVDLSRYLLPKFANATARRLDWSCTSADGSADTTDGGHTGIFYGGTAAVATAGNVSVETLDYEDFLKAMLAVDSAALTRPCMWWMHPQMIVRALSIKDLNGRPIFLPSTDAPSLGAIGSILGFPVKPTYTAPNVNGVSAKIAAFGDPMGEAVCLRQDFEFAASDQVKFLEDKTVFRARARGAAKVKQATAFGVLTTAAA